MSKSSPIAVVGVSSIFPGSPQVSGFWRDILQGKDQIREIPESYWLIDDYYDKNPQAQDKTYGRRGAFIESVAFDCIEHGILPSQLQDIDTVQLLALVAAQHVLRDAAKGDYKHLDKSRMSVILGVAGGTEQLVQMGARLQKPVWLKSLREAGIAENLAQEICQRIADHYVPWSEASFPGLLGNVVAGRIANRLDLGGTNCVVDAACASSCSALAMAVNELHLGHSDFVITGGADALNDILMYMCFSKTPALSATGDCRPFSDAADGTILGEGVGMLALRRLEDAERDGDTIYAVIKGVGSSSDGAGTAVYAPVSEGQAKAINRAYTQADFSANTIELIEAHGTGTKAGDKAEFNGLNIAFDASEQSQSSNQWCALGSVKSQIGHAKGAAGAAALIKAVMALHHKVLPPTIKVNQPNPAFNIEQTPFYINTKLRPWVRNSHYPRRAGVSSFGFGGSNFHVALEEYTTAQANPRLHMVSDTHLVLAAGGSHEELFRTLINTVDNLPSDNDALEYFARQSQETVQASQPYRVAFVIDSIEQLRQLIAQAKQQTQANTAKNVNSPSGWFYGVTQGATAGESDDVGHGKIACLFPGQGSQYVDMCAPLATVFPAAREVWDSAESNFTEGESLSRVVFPISTFSEAAEQSQRDWLNQTEWAQPAIGAASLSVWALLKKLGLNPEAFAGHSYGELTALSAAGVLSEQSLIATARARGLAMRDASASTSGAMAAVHASVNTVNELLEKLLSEAKRAGNANPILTLANINSPSQVVISGATEAVEAFTELCEQENIRVSKLPVSTAFHSPIVAQAAATLADHLKTTPFNPIQKAVYANKTAQPYPSDVTQQQQLLTQQLISPVRFQEQIEAMYAQGYRTFIEVGPGNVLTGLVGAILQGKNHIAIATDKKANNSLATFWKALGQLTCLGVKLDYSALWQDFRKKTAPADRVKPKMALPITGINYNRVYPPKNGAAGIPPANPEEPLAQSANTQATTARAATAQATTAQPIKTEQDNLHSTNNNDGLLLNTPYAQPHAASSLDSNSVATSSMVSSPIASESTTSSHQAHLQTEDSPISNFTPNQKSEWLAAFENIQKQTNETHRQFLQMSEQALAQLGQLVASGSAAPVDTSSVSAQAEHAIAVNNLDVSAHAQYQQPQPAIQNEPNVAPAGADIVKTVAEPAALSAMPLPATQNLNVAEVMLNVVADKTGYPREMLALSMSLENDLGIDSIKRVEILSATLDVVPNLPEVNPSDMAVLSTLEEVVQFIQRKMAEVAPSSNSMGTQAIAPVESPQTDSQQIDSSQTVSPEVESPQIPSPAQKVVADINVNDLLMQVVADKTGYPLEMLNLDMHLDADLGIDSIKRVEILSAATEQLDSLPELDNSVMAGLNTLAEISRYITAQLGAANGVASETIAQPATHEVSTPSITSSDNTLDIQHIMLSVVAEKTGYPVDMLEPSMDLENDLGIDSIKRVEILSATLEKVPNLPEFDAASMSSLNTLAEIIEFIKKQLGSAKDETNPSAAVVEKELLAAATNNNLLSRYELELLQLPRPNFMPHQLMQPLVIVPANSPCAQPLCDALKARGLQAEVAQRVSENHKAVISLNGLQKFKHSKDALAINRVIFEQACTLAPVLEKEAGVFIAVQNTSGDYGQSGASGVQSWSGGISGLVKTAAQEWPAALVRSIDINIEKITLAELVNNLAQEIVDGGIQREVALGLHGKRCVPVSVKAGVQQGSIPLHKDDVVLVTGGARGVTAEAILALSKQLPLKFALLGRSPVIDVSRFEHCVDEAAIMRAILAEAKAAGIQMLPAELKREVGLVVSSREVSKTLSNLQAAGSQVSYFPCDINNQDQLAEVVKQIQTQLGPISGVVHGAGVLADKLLSGKKNEHFEAVFGTKVQGLHNLLNVLADQTLKVLCLFSSVAARAGNIGQSDYAMANEVLNRVAAWYSSANNTKVVAINWGPWESGMVTDALKQKFAQMGVELIPLHSGAQFFVDELQHSQINTEVVYGGMPLNKPLANPGALCSHKMQVVASLQSLPHLESHKVRGEIVLPVVQVVDWFRSAMLSVLPSLKAFTLLDLKVLKGIVLSEPHATFTISLEELPNSTLFSLGLTDADGVLRYSANVNCLDKSYTDASGTGVGESVEAPPRGLLSKPSNPSYTHFNPYKELLFHGEHYQSITRIGALDDDSAVAELIGTNQLNWSDYGASVDQAILDGALQLVLVWGQKHINRESLPMGFDTMQINHFGTVQGAVRCYLQREKHDSVSTVSNIWLLDSADTVLACIRGLRMYAVNESLR
ncbi:type I polyketide synthase [Saccharophagus degradans]|uniref:SDR family oxidoreductase n=1 Tax=Saccharophagus degradans TaxID=86304 RepID=A0AAW7X3W6_9GAMM|nr:type I polyketide synthase [Saccharophagus degradans]MDO6422264.1 SDR family oxidoreductase [Saccharophagus degradans]MDO6607461.1 SDR family oxidoreductase [Saccharophagus degradans]